MFNQNHIQSQMVFQQTSYSILLKKPLRIHANTVEPRFTGPRFAGEPRFTGQEPADQTFHYISLRQKPRFTRHKTPILGIFSQKM